jgi:hypothetical protein
MFFIIIFFLLFRFSKTIHLLFTSETCKARAQIVTSERGHAYGFILAWRARARIWHVAIFAYVIFIAFASVSIDSGVDDDSNQR